MSKSVVFLLHGTGTHTDEWATAENGPITALRTAAKQYAFFADHGLDTFVEFVPIRYDDIFDKILQHWADLGQSITNQLGGPAPGAVQKTLDILAKFDGDRDAMMTNGGDVVLYRGFRLFGQRVLMRVISKMADVIARKSHPTGEPVEFHVVAHSLGTTVVHDALHHLGTEDWLGARFPFEEEADAQGVDQKTYADAVGLLRDKSGKINPFSPKHFAFDSVTMISNTSRLLHTTLEDPLHSIVRPGTATDESAYVRMFVNVDHKLDPISKVKQFDMPESWKMLHSQDLELKHVHARNIHAYDHYILNPEVHLRLLQFFVNPYIVSDADLRVMKKFKRLGGEFDDVNAYIASVETIVTQAKQADSLEDWVDVFKDAKELFA